MLHNFEYHSPRKNARTARAARRARRARPCCCRGTDLLVNVRSGSDTPALVVDVKRVEGYEAISWSDADGLAIRPATTINDILRHPKVRAKLSAARLVRARPGLLPIRNRATVIGNIVNASPCSDMAPALLCLDARAVIASRKGEREVRCASSSRASSRTVLAPDEILERVEVPAPPRVRGAPTQAQAHQRTRPRYRRSGRPQAERRAAACHQLGGPDTCARGRAHGVHARRRRRGRGRKAISPISDLRCTQEYRYHMVEVFVRRLLQEVK